MIQKCSALFLSNNTLKIAMAKGKVGIDIGAFSMFMLYIIYDLKTDPSVIFQPDLELHISYLVV